jgi:hypothetical protein
MFIPVPLLGNKTYTGTTQPKRSGIWDVGASYRAKFEGPKEKRTKVAREYTLSTPIVYNQYVNPYETIKFSPDGKSLWVDKGCRGVFEVETDYYQEPGVPPGIEAHDDPR